VALGPDALTTWDRVKAVLGYQDDQEMLVEFLIDAVSVTANRIAGRKLKLREYDDLRLGGSGRPALLVPEYPIVEVAHLWVDPKRVFDDATEIPASDFLVTPEAGMIELYSGVFPRGIGAVKFSGTLGYDEVPQDLELAAIECIDWNVRRLSSGTVGTRAVSKDGNVTSQYEITIPTTALSVFESYKSMRL